MKNKIKNLLVRKTILESDEDFKTDSPLDDVITPKPRKIRIRQNIKASIFVIIIIVIVSVNISSILKKIINIEDVKEEIQKELSEITGKTAIIKGDIDLEIVPKAIIKINNLVLEENKLLNSTEFIKVDQLFIYPNLLKLFIGKISFENIQLNKAEVFMKKPTGQPGNFEECFKYIYKLDGTKYDNKITKFGINKLSINLIKGTEDKQFYNKVELSDISINVKNGLNFNAISNDKKFNGVFRGQSSGDSSLNLNITNNGTINLNVNGSLQFSDTLKFSGNLAGNLEGVDHEIIKIIFSNSKLSQIAHANEKYDVKSEVYINDNNLVLPNLKISNSYFETTTKFGFAFADKNNVIADVEVTKLDFNKIFPDGIEVFLKEIDKGKKQKSKNNIFAQSEDEKALNKDLNKSINNDAKIPESTTVQAVEDVHNNDNATSDESVDKTPKIDKDTYINPIFLIDENTLVSAKINIQNITIGDLNFNLSSRFDIDGENFTIGYINTSLPGETVINLSSNLKIDKTKKHIIGASNLSFYSKDSKKFIDIIDKDKSVFSNNIPDLIALKAEIYNYENKIHFRKIEIAFDENKSLGQLVIDFSDHKIVGNSAFKVNRIDFDSIASEHQLEDESILRKLDFVRYFDTIFDNFNLSLQADELNYNKKPYNNFSSFVNISDGKIYFNDMQMSSEENGEISGKFDAELDVFQPKVNLDFVVSRMVYGGDENAAQARPILDGKWIEKEIKLDKYSLITGSAKLAADEVIFYGIPLSNLRLDTVLSSDKIKINKSRFDYNSSKFDFDGEMTTEFPSLSLSFTATNLEISRVLADLVNNKSVIGNFNISGNIGMNGANTTQWLESMKGAINFTSTGIRVKGFDVAKLSEKVSESNKIKEIRFWSDKFLSNGETVFGYLTGTTIIDDGVFEIKDLALSNPNLRTGKFYTKYNLPKWSADSILDLNVVTKTGKYNSGTEFPVQIMYNGNINSPLQSKDIKGIEKYWENKFYQ